LRQIEVGLQQVKAILADIHPRISLTVQSVTTFCTFLREFSPLHAKNAQWMRPIERSQHLITQAARDCETAESFGSKQTAVAKPIRTAQVAQRLKTTRKRLATSPQVIARIGDRTQKGQRLSTLAFRITLQ